MDKKVRETGKALRAALAAVKEFESPVLSAQDRKELDKIAKRVVERLAALNVEERRLALQ